MHKSVLQAGAISFSPEQTIEFHSRGRVLLIGDAAQLDAVAPHLASLDRYCVITDGQVLTDSDGLTVIARPLESLSGWLGAFSAKFDDLTLSIDLVLDLADRPAITTAVAPLGYFAPGEDRQVLAEALQQLPELVGVFDKPKFFNYREAICAHGRRGISGCSNCIEACPAAAIASDGERIDVNPSLCQGCGSCTVVCPSGAISYALPTLDASIDRLRRMMQHYFNCDDASPHVLIHDESHAMALLEGHGYALPDHVIAFSVEEIGALGMPFWFSSLAFGAGRVTIWDAGSHADHDWAELQHVIAQAAMMVAALGYGEGRIDWLATSRFDAVRDHIQRRIEVMPIARARFAGIDDKRRMTALALEHLHQHAPAPVDVLALDTDAAFGEIRVDEQACTLCMSCVSVCPVGAVLDGVDKPQLNFIEDLCVQCGMCVSACPEDAITLNARYLFDREQARSKRVLHEEAVFHCEGCNKPFATRKMIDTMMARLAGHSMFQGAALERLKLCEDCRVKAMFSDERR